MNRRGFIRGAISVMAVAAVLKGRGLSPRLLEPGDAYSTLTTSFDQNKLFKSGDYLHWHSGDPNIDNNGVYLITEVKSDVLTLVRSID